MNENNKRKLEQETTPRKKARNESYFAVFGNDAKPSIELKLSDYLKGHRTHLSLKDVQNLILWVFGEGINPHWILLKNKLLISRVVVIGLDCLDYEVYSKYGDCLQALTDMGSQACLTYSASSRNESAKFAFLNALFKVTVKKPKKQSYTTLGSTVEALRSPQKKLDEKSSDQEKTTEQKKTYPIELFIHNKQTLIDHNFPVIQKSGFVETQEHPDINQRYTSPLIAMDCEMCYTKNGLELTRLTLVDEKQNVIYDKYVKPANEIIDYNTKYSGITKELLDGISTTLEEVQQDILKIIYKNTVLVGHSLENDLHCCKLIHSRILDTSILYPHPGNSKYKFSLKKLCQKYLGRTIQKGEGHNSVEDAIAALDLVKLKLEKGPEFGVYKQSETENILNILFRNKKNSVLIDEPELCKYHGVPTASLIPCITDDEVLQHAKKEVVKENNDFIWLRFHGLRDLYTKNPNPEDEELKSVLKNLNNKISELWKEIPENTLLIICTGYGNTPRIEQCKKEFTEVSPQVTAAIETAKNALTFFAIKPKS